MLILASKTPHTDAHISNIRICIRITQLSPLGIRARAVIAVIQCGYYPLSTYAVITILN
jgi:hypothetical protein